MPLPAICCIVSQALPAESAYIDDASITVALAIVAGFTTAMLVVSLVGSGWAVARFGTIARVFGALQLLMALLPLAATTWVAIACIVKPPTTREQTWSAVIAVVMSVVNATLFACAVRRLVRAGRTEG